LGNKGFLTWGRERFHKRTLQTHPILDDTPLFYVDSLATVPRGEGLKYAEGGDVAGKKVSYPGRGRKKGGRP